MALLTREGGSSLLSLLFLKALVETRKVSFFTFGGPVSHHFFVFKSNFFKKTNKQTTDPCKLIPEGRHE